ncbi:MAG: dihydrodipicolinate synthase family protein [Rhodoglobus sp.]
MTTTPLRGIVPPLVTPLLDSGEIDVDSLRDVVDQQISAGVHGVFVLGSTGEVAYFDDDQRSFIMSTVVAAVAGRVPVLAGVIDLTARRVMAQVRLAVAAGVDGVVVTAPIYALNDIAEIETHYRVIAEASPVPVYAYDIPVRVKTKLDAAMLVRLGLDGVIAGVKDSSGDDVGFRRLVAANKAAGSPLVVLTGHEVVVDGMLLLGADGVVPGLANVDPAGYVRLWKLAQEGKWDEVAAEQTQLADLFEITAQPIGRSGDSAGVGSFKTAMHALGLIRSNTMAYPIERLDAATTERIASVLEGVGLAIAPERSLA